MTLRVTKYTKTTQKNSSIFQIKKSADNNNITKFIELEFASMQEIILAKPRTIIE